jgi:UDP-N-acetylmuramoyl-tripeptide--D-alanyl-D-alanine ligase
MLHQLVMKNYIKSLVTKLLWLQVNRLRQKHKPIVIAVAGSIGKTGTKSAIAVVLQQSKNVQWQDGNYNDLLSVPLIFFGKKAPAVYNIFAWLWILLSAEVQINGAYAYDIVVVELGTDHPGDMASFKQYFQADYGVLTAITPEHMENFADMDAVALEELVISDLSDTVLYDSAAVPKKYHQMLKKAQSYGAKDEDASYKISHLSDDLTRTIELKVGSQVYRVEVALLGKQQLPALSCAALLATKLKMSKTAIQKGLEAIKPLPGRMQVLAGENNSILIDDTYNASPNAVKAALDTLYEVKAEKKIAVLGQMNELGKHSEQLHTLVGEYCDPKQLDLVVTIGEEANKYLAQAAGERGCNVMRCPSPYHAADVVRLQLQPKTVVLVKGSQNGVFAEETVRELLTDPHDAKKLVRQSRHWHTIKTKQFGG